MKYIMKFLLRIDGDPQFIEILIGCYGLRTYLKNRININEKDIISKLVKKQYIKVNGLDLMCETFKVLLNELKVVGLAPNGAWWFDDDSKAQSMALCEIIIYYKHKIGSLKTNIDENIRSNHVLQPSFVITLNKILKLDSSFWLEAVTFPKILNSWYNDFGYSYNDLFKSKLDKLSENDDAITKGIRAASDLIYSGRGGRNWFVNKRGNWNRNRGNNRGRWFDNDNNINRRERYKFDAKGGDKYGGGAKKGGRYGGNDKRNEKKGRDRNNNYNNDNNDIRKERRNEGRNRGRNQKNSGDWDDDSERNDSDGINEAKLTIPAQKYYNIIDADKNISWKENMLLKYYKIESSSKPHFCRFFNMFAQCKKGQQCRFPHSCNQCCGDHPMVYCDEY